MGTANALHTHGTGVDGGTDARTARHAQGGLIAVQGPTALDVRTGVLLGPGSAALITGTSDTGPMTVSIAPHVPVSSRGTANGAYLGPALEAATKVNIAAAPGAGAGDRIDVVYFKQQDKTAGVPTPDTVYAPLYGVKQGTAGLGKPSLSTIVGAVELGTVTVSPGATSTNGANVVITNTARQTVARGAPIPVSSKDERDALLLYPGLQVMRLDTADARIETRTPAGGWACTIYGYADNVVFDPTSGIYNLPHGMGRKPLAWGTTLVGQDTDAATLVMTVMAWSSDATNLIARARREDTHVYFGQNLSFGWWARFV